MNPDAPLILSYKGEVIDDVTPLADVIKPEAITRKIQARNITRHSILKEIRVTSNLGNAIQFSPPAALGPGQAGVIECYIDGAALLLNTAPADPALTIDCVEEREIGV